jgi:hypothetical protein
MQIKLHVTKKHCCASSYFLIKLAGKKKAGKAGLMFHEMRAAAPFKLIGAE